MLRVPAQARVLLAATFGLGLSILALAVLRGGLSDLSMLALFATAVVLTELFQVEEDERSLDPRDAHISSFSTSVRFAAVIVLGPWAAALLAAFGVLAVDGPRGRHWSKVAFNASAFAAAAFGAGLTFELAGGHPGQLHLPGDFVAVGAMALVHMLINTGLVSTIIATTSARSPWPVMVESTRSELPATVEEAGLGVLIALCILVEHWALAALVPLLVAVYHAHSRLAMLRRETARALETFANVVDERDPHTYRHSLRVADSVRRLAEGLRLPTTHVFRLHWAGRLHDLGKIAVDAAVLRKPGKLDQDEWAALRRHPRLSARLLQRFRFASGEARAVEYHHERFDGRGYYTIDSTSIPLAAHFLIVADSYDAMRSDRPYRLGMTKETALEEIEKNAGTQFHPVVAKAFVALERGADPLAVLSPAERDELRTLTLRRSRLRGLLAGATSAHPELLVVGSMAAGLFFAAFQRFPLALAAFFLCGAGIAWQRVQIHRGVRLAGELQRVLRASTAPTEVFNDVASRLAYSCQLRWAGLMSWSAADLSGRVELDWGSPAQRPTETALGSWLIRETEAATELLVAGHAEVGHGAHVAVPLRRDGLVTGYFVLVFARAVPTHVEVALRRCGEELSSLAGLDEASPAPRLAAVS